MNNGFRSLAILNDYEKKVKDQFFYKNLQRIYKTPVNYTNSQRNYLSTPVKVNNQRCQSPKKANYYEFNKLPAIVKLMDERNQKEHTSRLNNIEKRKNLYTACLRKGKEINKSSTVNGNSNSNNSNKYSHYYKPIKKENSNFYSRIQNM